MIVIGEDGDQRRSGIDTKPGGVLPVDDCATGENRSVDVRKQSYRQVLPIHHVLADGVSPVHRTPGVSVRVILIEEVIRPLEIDQTVRVIHPLLRRREVVLRSILLTVLRRSALHLRHGEPGRHKR